MEEQGNPRQKGGFTAIEYGIMAVLAVVIGSAVLKWLDPYLTWAIESGMDALLTFIGLI